MPVLSAWYQEKVRGPVKTLQELICCIRRLRPQRVIKVCVIDLGLPRLFARFRTFSKLELHSWWMSYCHRLSLPLLQVSDRAPVVVVFEDLEGFDAAVLERLILSCSAHHNSNDIPFIFLFWYVHFGI